MTKLPSPDEQLRFLNNVQKVLDEGDFVSTYKFALLMALADISIELGDDAGDELIIEVTQIGEKFIQYYWGQSASFPLLNDGSEVLFQNTGRQAAVVSKIQSYNSQSFVVWFNYKSGETVIFF